MQSFEWQNKKLSTLFIEIHCATSYNLNVIDKLPGDYIAGFIDGEGCFYLTYRSEIKQNRPGKPTYYRWLPYFAMTLREDDVQILEKIKNTLGCGNIYFLKKDSKRGRQAYFGIQNIDDLYNIVMPFFKKYHLRAKKRLDFELWCSGLKILHRNKKNKLSCSAKDNSMLVEIRKRMRTYKSDLGREYKNSPIM